MRVSPFFMISLFEFRRHLDIRGEVAGLLLLAVIALVKLGGDAILARESAAVVHLDARGTPVAGLSEGRFHFSDALGDGVSGDPPILSSVAGDYVLHTEQPPGWLGELQRSLDTLHRQHSLSLLGVTRDQLRKVDSPVSLRVIDSRGTAVFADTSLTAVSIAMVVLTTLAILGCLGMIFQGLLGERFWSCYRNDPECSATWALARLQSCRVHPSWIEDGGSVWGLRCNRLDADVRFGEWGCNLCRRQLEGDARPARVQPSGAHAVELVFRRVRYRHSITAFSFPQHAPGFPTDDDHDWICWPADARRCIHARNVPFSFHVNGCNAGSASVRECADLGDRAVPVASGLHGSTFAEVGPQQLQDCHRFPG